MTASVSPHHTEILLPKVPQNHFEAHPFPSTVYPLLTVLPFYLWSNKYKVHLRENQP